MDDTPKEILKAQKLLAERFPNYIIIAQDGDESRFEKISNECWAYGIMAKTIIELEGDWKSDDELGDEVDD